MTHLYEVRYKVRSPGDNVRNVRNVRRIAAKNSTAAKREYCRRLGIRPSDYWDYWRCMTALTARLTARRVRP